MKRVFVTTAFLALLALGFEVAREAYFFLTPVDSEILTKTLLIEPGPFIKTSEFLHSEGLIKDPKRFYFLARLMRLSSKVKVGEYRISTEMSPYKILRVITSGKSILHAVKIPEGFNIDQIADVFSAKNLVNREEFVAMARDPRMAKKLGIDQGGLEGYLFPDTYSFTRFTGEAEIIRTMVARFNEVYNREVKFGANRQNMTQHQVVTLASIIEKETGVPMERPIISSVFHNRLKINMPLQSDPTVIYGKKGDKKNITRADLLAVTPYNTYSRKGLPIGPIGNPGKESLLAAIEPASTEFIYFVSRNDGTHYFSIKFSDHNNAVKKFQKDPKARQGKSWRDRLKK